MSISKGAKGAAGVNFVAAELSMLGKVALPTVGGSKKDTKKGNRGVGRDKAEVLKRSWVFSSLIS